MRGRVGGGKIGVSKVSKKGREKERGDSKIVAFKGIRNTSMKLGVKRTLA